MPDFENKVSIITPCYNAQGFIENTINSVVNQSFENWELIIVDDKSTDDTTSVIMRYASKDSRINLVVLDENSGSPVKPRNVGLGLAKGNIVCFLDADDIWYERKLEVQVKHMEDTGCSFSYMPYDIKYLSHKPEIIKTYIPPLLENYTSLLKLNTIGCLTVAIKKDLIKDELFKNIDVEDFEYWLRILGKKNCTAYRASDISHSCYHVRGQSRSSNKFSLLKGYWNIFRMQDKGIVRSVFSFLEYVVRYFFKYR
ncbi:glycosyltransferase family 2 protein [Vibrio jasicida]|uniref:glycosyltransferase family 2 protein n=1 Tax=Vibrio jasicida TaxID=766224 RepID=UPI000CE3F261|nr:glycosyltransferase [Vibrio jasicida]